jgi:hypothetical protein
MENLSMQFPILPQGAEQAKHANVAELSMMGQIML